MPVFEILLVRAVMVLSISYMKVVTNTQNTFPYTLGQRYKPLLQLPTCIMQSHHAHAQQPQHDVLFVSM